MAEKLGVAFIEGDKLHPAANVAKMSSGIPLTDEDRWPWLEEIGRSLAGADGKIASCSALKRVYRERIAKAAGRPVAFVFLDGSRELLSQRINARKNHVYVSMMYIGMLRRAPDQAGFDFYLNLLNQGTPGLNQVTGFYNSPEYRARFCTSSSSC